MRSFVQNARGNFAIIGALVLPVLLGAVGGMLDYHTYRSTSSTLQEIADAAALAAARESALHGWTDELATEVADVYVASNLKNAGLLGSDYSIDVRVNAQDQKVSVDITQDKFGYLIVGLYKQAPYITSSSTAQAVTDSNLCVLGLYTGNGRTNASIHLDDNSRIEAPDCGLYAESAFPGGFRIDRGASIDANLLCVVGGFHFTQGRQTVNLNTNYAQDCPETGNPLENRPMPTVSACDHTDLVVNAAATLQPGVYCGGLVIDGSFRANLLPGTYIIKDGPLLVAGDATIVGRGVGFYLTGDNSTFNFEQDTTVELAAPTSGLMAGLLFFEDPGLVPNWNFAPAHIVRDMLPAGARVHKISSNNARVLVGTFYTPHSILRINANAPVADRSAYTAIVSGRLWLQQGPTLVLNADYALTDVPVPDGIGPLSEGVRLVE